ncbi:sugar phosphate isomerase/epimerase family protein [Plantibacter sp. YIM 135347]|uniref:sugar phosphate isomerase/epimerase family protein n=1 Tax=Plantibacter sp. YIM 135347 TaxID=3423919 RepID=UPI003D32E2DD
MTQPVNAPDAAEGTPRIAVMAYTVLDQATADLPGTLARVADIGYLGIETYGIVERFGASAVRAALDGAGLDLTSSHAPFPAGADADRILDEYAELGATTLVWSMEREEFDSADTIAHGVERVNEAAERAGARGMRIGYHNHFAEFRNRIDGRSAYDVLLDRLHPDVVLELDLYWATMGGASLPELLDGLGDRVRFVHIKDGPAVSYEDDTMVPIGDGSIDWDAVLSAGTAVDWHIVELERLHIDTFEALERSYRHLVGRGLSCGGVPLNGANA